MTRERVLYWVATLLVVAVMAWSAVNFAFNPAMRGAFLHLGLPNWFRLELTVAKALGILALLVPGVPPLVKTFAYFGFGLTLVSATVAHLASGDNPWFELVHLGFFVCLVVSYLYDRKLHGRL